MSGQLSHLSANINDDLEHRMEDVVAALPRVLTEVERIESAVKALSADLAQLTGAWQTHRSKIVDGSHALSCLSKVLSDGQLCAHQADPL